MYSQLHISTQKLQRQGLWDYFKLTMILYTTPSTILLICNINHILAYYA